MKKRGQELKKNGKMYRQEARLQEAGNHYTAAAHEYAGTVTEHTFPECDKTNQAVGALCYAAVCYRLAGDEFRTRNRCEMGTLLAEDYSEFIARQEIEPGSFRDLRRGAWPEFIGDLRTIARRDGAAEAYEEAKDIYDRCDEWELVMAEEEHMRLAAFFSSVKRGAGYEISRDAPERLPLDGPTFSEWLEYKRERLPDLLDELEEQGEWPTG